MSAGLQWWRRGSTCTLLSLRTPHPLATSSDTPATDVFPGSTFLSSPHTTCFRATSIFFSPDLLTNVINILQKHEKTLACCISLHKHYHSPTSPFLSTQTARISFLFLVKFLYTNAFYGVKTCYIHMFSQKAKKEVKHKKTAWLVETKLAWVSWDRDGWVVVSTDWEIFMEGRGVGPAC